MLRDLRTSPLTQQEWLKAAVSKTESLINERLTSHNGSLIGEAIDENTEVVLLNDDGNRIKLTP